MLERQTAVSRRRSASSLPPLGVVMRRELGAAVYHSPARCSLRILRSARSSPGRRSSLDGTCPPHCGGSGGCRARCCRCSPMSAGAGNGCATVLDELERTDLRDYLPQVTAPALVICGSRDWRAMPAACELAGGLPDGPGLGSRRTRATAGPPPRPSCSARWSRNSSARSPGVAGVARRVSWPAPPAPDARVRPERPHHSPAAECLGPFLDRPGPDDAVQHERVAAGKSLVAARVVNTASAPLWSEYGPISNRVPSA